MGPQRIEQTAVVRGSEDWIRIEQTRVVQGPDGRNSSTSSREESTPFRKTGKIELPWIYELPQLIESIFLATILIILVYPPPSRTAILPNSIDKGEKIHSDKIP